MTDLQNTAFLMCSEDYKERFAAEYWQLRIRLESLTRMIEKYRADTLTFTPTCSVHILERQAESMLRYLRILNLRAKIEHINLSESVFYGKP